MHDSRNMDGSAFDGDRYVQDLLSEKSLPELVAFQESLARETKALDSGMQNLVYDNYNKFIAATDTVRAMKDSVGDIETEMQRLTEKMEQLGATSRTVDTHLAPNRQRIEQLVGVRRLLEKLEFLFELPGRLSRSIELEAYGQAVRYYCAAAPVLRRQAGDLRSLDTIRRDADAIMEDLKRRLQRTLQEPTSRSSDFLNALRWLRQLNEPVAHLHGRFLAWEQWQLERELQAVRRRLGSLAQQPGGEEEEEEEAGEERERSVPRELPLTLVDMLLQGFVERYVDASEIHRQLFLQEEDARGGGDGGGGEEAEGLDSTPEDRDRSWRALGKDLWAQFFGVLRSILTASWPEWAAHEEEDEEGEEREEEEAEEEGGEGEGGRRRVRFDRRNEQRGGKDGTGGPVVQALERALGGLRQVAPRVLEVRILDRAAETAEEGLRGQISRVFVRARARLAHRIVRLPQLAAEAAREEEQQPTPSPPPAAPAPAAAGSRGRSPTDAAAQDMRLTVRIGRRIRNLAREEASTLVRSLEQSLASVRPWTMAGLRLLPELARAFAASVEGHTLQTLVWFAAAMEAALDPWHPARQEIGVRCLEMLGAAAVTDATPDQDSAVRALRRRVRVVLPRVEGFDVAEARKPPATRGLGPGPLGALLCACLARWFADHGVTRVLSAMIHALPSTEDLLECEGAVAGADEAAGMTSSYGAMIEVPLLIRRVQGAGRTLLRTYAQVAGDHLGQLLRQTLETADGQAADEPRGARLVVPLLARAVAQARPLVAAALGESPPPVLSSGVSQPQQQQHAVTRSPVAGGVPSRGADEAVEESQSGQRRSSATRASGLGAGGTEAAAAAWHRDIEQLFAGGDPAEGTAAPVGRGGDRGGGRGKEGDAEYRGSGRTAGPGAALALPSVGYTMESVTAAMLRRGFHSMLATIRAQTYNGYGFQQLQVDIATSWLLSAQLLGEERRRTALEQLLDECLSSAAERTVEWSPLERSIVFMLAHEALQQHQWEDD